MAMTMTMADERMKRMEAQTTDCTDYTDLI